MKSRTITFCVPLVDLHWFTLNRSAPGRLCIDTLLLWSVKAWLWTKDRNIEKIAGAKNTALLDTIVDSKFIRYINFKTNLCFYFDVKKATRFTNLSRRQISLSIYCSRKLAVFGEQRLTVWKVLVKSKDTMNSGMFCLMYFSCICFRMKIMSAVLLPALKPHQATPDSLLSKTLANTFPGINSSDMPQWVPHTFLWQFLKTVISWVFFHLWFSCYLLR